MVRNSNTQQQQQSPYPMGLTHDLFFNQPPEAVVVAYLAEK